MNKYSVVSFKFYSNKYYLNKIIKKGIKYITRQNIITSPYLQNDTYYICKYNENEFKNNKDINNIHNQPVSPWHELNLISDKSFINIINILKSQEITQNLKLNKLIELSKKLNISNNDAEINYTTLLIEYLLENNFNKDNNNNITDKIYNELKFNSVIEIPKDTCAKFEVNKSIYKNPIMQDNKWTKNGCNYSRFNKLNYIVHYGMLPLTWETNKISIINDGINSYKGDDDPLDMIEISNSQYYIGDVIQVDILGAICLIDQNEADWKIITISSEYLNKNNLKTEDITTYISNYINKNSNLDFAKLNIDFKLDNLIHSLTYYKTYEGKTKNKFHLTEGYIKNNEIKNNNQNIDIKKYFFNKEKAIKVIFESYCHYINNKEYLINRMKKI